MKRLGRSNEQFVDWLPWLLPLDPAKPEVIATACGGLMRVARILPPDLETASHETLVSHHQRVATILARLGNDWSVWLDQWRTRSTTYLPPCSFGGNVAAQAIDGSRRRFFAGQERPVFDNAVFLTLHQRPISRSALMMSWLMDRTTPQAQAFIDGFIEASTALFAELRLSFRGVDVLGGRDLASYLASSVTYEPQGMRWPSGVIARGLAVRPWDLGERVRIGRRHLATVEVLNYGSPSPLSVDGLHELPFELRWVTTMHGLDPESRRKEIQEARKRWLAMQSNVVAMGLQRWIGEARKDPEAIRALEDLEVMQANLADVPRAFATTNVHVWSDRSEAEAWDRAAEVVTLLKGADLAASVATLNSAMAPLADMPGALGKEVANLRRSLEDIRAITRVAPVTGVSSGSKDDWRFGGPALLVGLTRHKTPLYWSLNAHHSERAHCGIVGKNGSGKSALLSFMAAQFLRYEGATVIVFDRRRSFLVTCLALGGDWIELGGGGHGVQPLRAIDRADDMAWAHNWLLQALQVQGMRLQTHTEGALADALSHVADLPADQRTLSSLHTYLSGDEQARQALKAYLKGGSYGSLFDGTVAAYGSRPVVGIETSGIAGLKQVAPLVISAVFRAVQRDRLIGDAPKLVMVDEAWALLQSDLFVGEIEAWARELRKLKAVLVLATQSMGDFAEGKAKVIFDELGNRVYLPHDEAMRPQSREMYQRVGLLDEQIQALTTAQSKGEYLLQTAHLTRLIGVRLEDDALALCGAGSPVDHARAFALLKQGVEPGEDFTRAWLSESTAEWQAHRPLHLVGDAA